MLWKKLAKYALITSILIVSGLLIAVYFVNKEDEYLKDHPSTTGNTVSIILIDGLSQKVFEKAIAENQLPNIQFLLENGTYIKNGISSFPSMTGYSFYPFITGVDASKSGVLGLRWFDRSRDMGNLRNYVGRSNVYMNQDITDTIKTIFERSGEMYTASINSYMNKGVDDSRMSGWAHTTAKFEGKSVFKPLRTIPILGEEIAKNHFQHETEVLKMAKDQLKNNPKVQWITFPSLDASHHVFGMTDNYLNLLKHLDHLIGEFSDAIDSLGQDQTRMIALVTDHGISDVSKNIDIVPLARDSIGLDLIRGNAVNYRTMQLKTPLQDFIEKDGYWVINGNLSSYLYLRDPAKVNADGWRQNIKYENLLNYKTGNKVINIPKSFVGLEGIELVIYKKDAQNIIVQNKEGIAYITKKENTYSYQPQSSDPLQYSELNLLDTFLTKNEWLEHTINSTYPDAVYRIFSLMEAPNIGDLVITSEKGYDLAKDYEMIVDNYKGGHGGLRAEQLRVPYILYRKNQQTKVINHARAEDVGQMIINWLGFEYN